MPKIPRLQADVPNAAVPGASPLSPEAVATPLAGIAGVADTVFDIASAESKRQSEQMRAALEAKQAIVNEVEAGRRAGDYEEDLAAYSEGIKKQFWEEPDKAPAQLLEVGRTLQDRQRDAVPNTQVGLEFAQRSNARLSAMVREMHDWALSRQTQKAKGDLSVIVNRATAGAEGVSSVPALKLYIANKEKELESVFNNVLGSDAPAKMAEMRAGMARAWARVNSDTSAGALMVLGALDDTRPGNPLVDNLKDTERDALRRDAKAGFAGSFKTRLLDEVKKGLAQNRDLFDLTMADPQSAGKALIATQTALEEQYVAVKVQKKIDVEALAKWGIDLQGSTPDEIPDLISDRIRYVKALDFARRNMIGFDAEDDPTALAGAVRRTNKLINSTNGKTLANIVKQEADLAEAYSDKKLSTPSMTALFNSMALSLNPALEKAEDPWGPDRVRAWFSPRIAGDVRLNDKFKEDAKIAADKAFQDRVRIRYYAQLNGATQRGVVLKKEEAREMAMRAYEYEVARKQLEEGDN